MPTTRLFYAQPVDLVPHEVIKQNVDRLQKLTHGMAIEVVAPYLDEESAHSQRPLDRERAKQVLRKDFAAVDGCEMILADLSQEDRQAVGMIFELAHAFEKNKTILVYTGDSQLGNRVCIIAAADCICRTWMDVKEALRGVGSRRLEGTG